MTGSPSRSGLTLDKTLASCPAHQLDVPLYLASPVSIKTNRLWQRWLPSTIASATPYVLTRLLEKLHTFCRNCLHAMSSVIDAGSGIWDGGDVSRSQRTARRAAMTRWCKHAACNNGPLIGTPSNVYPRLKVLELSDHRRTTRFPQQFCSLCELVWE